MVAGKPRHLFQMLTIVNDNILNSKEKYIAHVCNAVANQAGGITHYIFEKFPYANIYKSRPFPYRATGPNFPGHCIVKGDGIKDRFVINMISQYDPATPLNGKGLLDGYNTREGYFNQCLRMISRFSNLESIAFPYYTGCFLTGGNWDNYVRMIRAFAIGVSNTQNAKVYVYKPEL